MYHTKKIALFISHIFGSPERWAEEIIALRDDESEIDQDKLSRFDAKYMVKQMEKIYGC